jgi:hypothetical protein
MTMSRNRILVAALLLAFAPMAGAQTTPPTPTTPPTTTTPPPTTTPPATTTTSVPANRLAGLFTGFLGSRENALAVVNALRNGTSATVVTTPTCAAPCTKPPTGTSTTIEVPTKPMGWGNVRHALALAQYSLAQAGITNPTPAQLAAALNGGTVTTSAGKPVELRGVLTMRASGMGWGNIARAEGTTMGNVNHGLKHAATPPPPTTTTASTPVAPRNIGITSAAGAPSGIVTAAGGGGSSHQPGRGIVNGNGGGASGVASGNGNGGGNGHGNGNGHAGGGGAGVTTAGNSAASTTVTTASNGHGNGNGNGNGNGKAKGK